MKKVWKAIKIFLLIVVILFVVLIVIGIIAGGSGDVETSVNTPAVETAQAKETPIPTPTSNPEPAPDSTPVPTPTNAPEPEETEFTVEHDQKYLDTQNYIWEFLIDKGYEVQTVVGVPNIGRTDADLGEGYEGWYAYIKYNGEWKEFSVVLFNGEVSAIQPVK